MKENKDGTLMASADDSISLRQILVSVIILGVAILAVVILMKTKPKAEPKHRGERASVVKVVGMKRSSERVVVNTSGTVVPGREIILQARVAGEIVSVDPRFIPGGRFETGEVMLEIDPADYEIAVTKSSAAVVKAEYDLEIEMGMQDIARYEWDAMQEMDKKRVYSELDRELALRVPHLRLAQGALDSAGAQLRQAKLNLARCSVRAPFNAIVRFRNVDVGSQVSMQSNLAGLAGTDAYWIMLTLPARQMHWFESSSGSGKDGSPVIVTASLGMDLNARWDGYVLRKLVDLEKKGMQGQILVEVPEPDDLGQKTGGLLLGAYVHATITGKELSNVFAIPRRALRGGDKVWIMTPDARLDIRNVDVVWADKDRALINTGVESGEKLIVTDIGIPINGMLLNIEGEDKSSNKPSGAGKRGKGRAGR